MPRLSFRDGDRDVPDHVAELMRPIDTYKLTYEQAQTAANDRLLQNEIERRSAQAIRDHFNRFSKG